MLKNIKNYKYYQNNIIYFYQYDKDFPANQRIMAKSED